MKSPDCTCYNHQMTFQHLYSKSHETKLSHAKYVYRGERGQMDNLDN